MKNILIKVNGYLGDILFSSSVASQLHKKYDEVQVHLQIQFFQPYELLMLNPYIYQVWVGAPPIGLYTFDKVYEIGQIDQSEPATIQFQRQCEIEEPHLPYLVYTNQVLSDVSNLMFKEYRKAVNKPIVAYPADWEDRTFLFTKEEYVRGINIPGFGYGGKHRNIKYILKELSKHYTLLEVGFPPNTPQAIAGGMFTTSIYSMTASLIKYCDWMIGSEGGLTNLAAGVGTKCIITTDFIHQLYGWNGCIKKIQNPKMGPATYFPDTGHIHLDPFLTDNDVLEQIIKTIGT